ncbi:hypothetical protein CAPTEDRAFT_195563 [Capitella teleta]|uniref:SWIM-type domain-containing protein n=1 Tax=Capitella teleta TaxID=283909 RepID=R7U3U5_CAPTE|nr:hypothetical protein CAPTEDRAFT_195563 [Capitella teleta]|eukprot:ELU01010.1 hypothetical protein CAPTEDRAFT_195563 [Capitella teleta]
MASNYGSMTVVQLRAELGKRNAKKTGKKAALVERLESYDRNQNFGRPVQQTDENAFSMSLPETSTFKDINADSAIPVVTLKNVNKYLEIYEQSITKKIKKLYSKKWIVTVRFSMAGNITFISGRVGAELKRKLNYAVDVSFDGHGIVQQAQCECGAGMGPHAHCKHVMIILYGLTFAKQGILTHETCTQRLQTFHQSRPNYKEDFRNAVVAHPNPRISMKQLYAPAYLEGVFHDHTYSVVRPAEDFLEENGISKINVDLIQDIEERTREQSKFAIWYKTEFDAKCSPFKNLITNIESWNETKDLLKICLYLFCNRLSVEPRRQNTTKEVFYVDGGPKRGLDRDVTVQVEVEKKTGLWLADILQQAQWVSLYGKRIKLQFANNDF